MCVCVCVQIKFFSTQLFFNQYNRNVWTTLNQSNITQFILIQIVAFNLCYVRPNKCSLFSNKHNGIASIKIEIHFNVFLLIFNKGPLPNKGT